MSRSIYQTNGKPLSQQALYQQKLKQGIYTSPSAVSVGVNSNASDTAALLAASADLTVRPSYERTVAQDAHTAALAAKHQNIKTWTRDHTDSDADAAAANARTSTLKSTTSSTYSVGTGIGSGSLKGDAIFKVASQNSTSTMTSRTNPERDVKRSGLVTKSSSSAFDINKISQAANHNSTKSLNSRFNPELDYRSGLKVKSQTEFLTLDEETLAASGAAASLKHGSGYSDQVSSQRRSQTFTARDVVGAKLLAAANANAQGRLNSLNSNSPKDLRAQAQLYANALTIAQKNSDERVRNNRAGVIELGGGLTITQLELDQLASTIVQPVLDDIDVKAASQRDIDNAYKKKQADLAKEHELAQQEQVLAKSKERAELEIAKQQRVTENEEKKRTEDGVLTDYQTERNEEVVTKEAEFAALEVKYAEEKEALLAEKQANQDRIDEEEAELIANRKKELEDAQAEKDELLQPVLDELEEENSKLKEVTDARDELKNEVTSAEELNKEYEEKLASLTEELEGTKKDIETYTTDLEEAEKKHEETTKEVDELHQRSIVVLKNAEDSLKQLDTDLDDLSKQKEEHLTNKALQKEEIQKELDAKVKDEHKINAELPEHLKRDVDESKLKDTGSLFSVEAPKHKEVVVEEPKVEAKKETKVETPKKVEVPVKTTSANSENSKLKKALRRLSNFFKAPASSPTKPKAVVSAPVSKAADTVKPKASEPATKATKKSTTDSLVSAAEYDDDLSINKDHNKGGLFKEEI